jgi:DNA-binding transcriptional LysR family regulator
VSTLGGLVIGGVGAAMRKNSEKDRPNSFAAGGERLGRFGLSPNLTARSIEIFVAVARAGSMSAAAQRLNLSQPAISQAIGSLETSLGVQLFDRSVRPPALTLQATALLPHASGVLESLQKLEGALRLGHLAELPALRIAMLNSVATTIGPRIINGLRDMATEVLVDSGFHATRFQSLTQRDFDFIITADESPVPGDVQVMPILSEPLLVVVPASYPGDPTHIDEVSESLDLIRFGRDPNLMSRIDLALQGRGLAPRRRYHLDTNEAVMQMVAFGAGWTILPLLSVIRSLARKEEIRVARFPGWSLTRSVVIAMRTGEGLHVAEHIRRAAIAALRRDIVPKIDQLVPEEREGFQLNDVSLVDAAVEDAP